MFQRAWVGFLILLFWGVSPAADTVIKKMDAHSFASLSSRHGLRLDVRVTHSGDLVPTVKMYLGRMSERITYGQFSIIKMSQTRVLIPFAQLSPPFQRSFVDTLWPKDTISNREYIHTVQYAGHETLWSTASWFTGSGKNYRAIQRASGLTSSTIRRGMRIRIPLELVIPSLAEGPVRDREKPPDPFAADQTPLTGTEKILDPEPTPIESSPEGTSHEKTPVVDPDGERPKPKTEQEKKPPTGELARRLGHLQHMRALLTYGTDSKGRYAQYRLRAGEAIYSSVVVRFCGLVSGEDVNRVARVIIDRNGIRDETDLPVGARIRIPYEYLEPEFRAEDDPEFQDFLTNQEAVAQVPTHMLSRNLAGVYVILDTGHGGRDPGAKFGSVWEDDFVYDIACRIKARIERETMATVLTTTYDPSVGYKVQDVSRFNLDRDEVLRTRPVYQLSSKRAVIDGVNLRWIFANHHFEQLTRKGVEPNNIVFCSLHADSLHPSIRGVMVYIPDARQYPARVGPPHSRYRRYAEYAGNQFSFDRKSMQNAQAHSANFAQNFVDHVRRHGLPVHRDQPIRSVIFRRARSRPFVPAVLKYNRIPTRCLIEVCNLNNVQDRQSMRDHVFRQKTADAFVDALYVTYGLEPEVVARNLEFNRVSTAK